METKDEKFQRLSASRSEKAIYHVSLISNLASSNYQYSIEDAEELLVRLDAAVDQVRDAFGLEKTLPEPVSLPGLVEGPVSGRDRRDIRDALRMLQSGQTSTGIKQLQSIICGWVVPDKVEEEND